MQFEITDDARALLIRKGGGITIDFLKAVGWGKVAEVSVDTNINAKNLTPYDRLRHREFEIYISPVLSGIASRMRLVTKGRFVKQLAVELIDPTSDRSAGDGCCP